MNRPWYRLLIPLGVLTLASLWILPVRYPDDPVPWWALVGEGALIFTAAVGILGGLFQRNEYAYRKAARDSGNPGPGPSAGHAASYARAIYGTGASYYYATGANPTVSRLDLPVRQAETPITAWKTAKIGWHDGDYRLVAMNSGTCYDKVAVAECLGASSLARLYVQSYSSSIDELPTELREHRGTGTGVWVRLLRLVDRGPRRVLDRERRVQPAGRRGDSVARSRVVRPGDRP